MAHLCGAVEKCVAAHRACLTEPAPETMSEPVGPPPEAAIPEDVGAGGGPARDPAARAPHGARSGPQDRTPPRHAHAATPETASLGTGSRRYGQIHAYSPYLHAQAQEAAGPLSRTGRRRRLLQFRFPAHRAWSFTSEEEKYRVDVPAVGPAQSGSLPRKPPLGSPHMAHNAASRGREDRNISAMAYGASVGRRCVETLVACGLAQAERTPQLSRSWPMICHCNRNVLTLLQCRGANSRPSRRITDKCFGPCPGRAVRSVPSRERPVQPAAGSQGEGLAVRSFGQGGERKGTCSTGVTTSYDCCPT